MMPTSQQQNRHIDAERERAHDAAEEQRAGVAHKDLGRVRVPEQEAISAPTIAAARIESPRMLSIIAMTENVRQTTSVTELFRPSRPSVK